MSDPGRPLSADDLKAPPGQFRVVKLSKDAGADNDTAQWFLVEDFVEKGDALDCWRNLWYEKQEGKEELSYVHDDQGRIVDAVGTHITEAERVAPPGKFRIICGDIHSLTIRLVADLDDRDKAIEYAKTADEGPYTGFQVHDETGKALLTV